MPFGISFGRGSGSGTAEPPLLVVGLGNPGARYAGNRHNIGFMAVDAIARRHGFPPWRSRFQGQVSEASVAGRRVLLLKPMTFMNRSGDAVGQAARYFKVPTTDVLVFHDELDLAEGRLRVKQGGGHAGHNGLRSLHAVIGPDYRRVRLGIGHPGDREQVLGHVLKDFAKADAAWLDPLLEAIAERFPDLVAGDAGTFMSKVAMALQPPKPPRAERSAAGDSGKDGAG
ncbi:MAG: aminoacyl-tRNA hydrolase [Rhodospirillales bacterium]|nr:MAG: aminoacyl-tRNA hydrolase [Rhodospirillales bacterium]